MPPKRAAHATESGNAQDGGQSGSTAGFRQWQSALASIHPAPLTNTALQKGHSKRPVPHLGAFDSGMETIPSPGHVFYVYLAYGIGGVKGLGWERGGGVTCRLAAAAFASLAALVHT